MKILDFIARRIALYAADKLDVMADAFGPSTDPIWIARVTRLRADAKRLRESTGNAPWCSACGRPLTPSSCLVMPDGCSYCWPEHAPPSPYDA